MKIDRLGKPAAVLEAIDEIEEFVGDNYWLMKEHETETSADTVIYSYDIIGLGSILYLTDIHYDKRRDEVFDTEVITRVGEDLLRGIMPKTHMEVRL